VHVHDGRAGVEGVARLGGHLRRGDRHRMLLRVGENAGEGAGEYGFFHEVSFQKLTTRKYGLASFDE
jgi:hypothetical protein